jgi:heme oxygenase
MVLDTDAFKESLKANQNQLDDKTRAAIVERADKAFAEIDQETEGTPAKPE